MLRPLLASLLTVLLLAIYALAHHGPRGSLDSGGGGGFPGISGVTGDDDTLEALYGLRNIHAYPDGPVYYVSCASGAGAGQITAACSSIGRGTLQEPLCDWADILPLVREGVTFRFDDEDTCFDYTNADSLDFATTVEYGDWRPIVRIDSTRIGHPFILTQTSEPAMVMHITGGAPGGPETAGGVVIIQDLTLVGSTNLGFVVDDGVRLVTNNLYCSSAVASNGSCVHPASDSKVLNLNGGGVGQDLQLFSGIDMSDSTYITKGTYHLTNSGSVGRMSTTATAGYGENISNNKPLRLNIIGATLSTGEVAAASGLSIDMGTSGIDNESWIDANLARVTIHGMTFGHATTASLYITEQQARRLTLRVYQSTFGESRRVFHFVGTDTGAVEAGSKILGRYNIYQQMSSGTSAFWIQAERSLSIQPLAEIVMRDSFVHQQSGAIANFFVLKDSTGASVAAPTVLGMRQDVALDSGLTATFDEFFADATTVVSGGALPTDDQFDGSGYRCADTLGLGGTPCSLPSTNASGGTADGYCDNAATFQCARKTETASCDLTETCGTAPAGTETYSVPVWIWGPVVGSDRDITSLTLTVDHWGAH